MRPDAPGTDEDGAPHGAPSSVVVVGESHFDRRLAVQAVGLIDHFVSDLAQLVQVLPAVMGTEEQVLVGAEASTDEGLGAAAVAAIGCGQGGGNCCSHGNHPLVAGPSRSPGGFRRRSSQQSITRRDSRRNKTAPCVVLHNLVTFRTMMCCSTTGGPGKFRIRLGRAPAWLRQRRALTCQRARPPGIRAAYQPGERHQ